MKTLLLGFITTFFSASLYAGCQITHTATVHEVTADENTGLIHVGVRVDSGKGVDKSFVLDLSYPNDRVIFNQVLEAYNYNSLLKFDAIEDDLVCNKNIWSLLDGSKIFKSKIVKQ